MKKLLIGAIGLAGLAIAGCGSYVPYKPPALQTCVEQQDAWQRQRDAGKITWSEHARRLYDAVPRCYPEQFQPMMFTQETYRQLLAADVDAGKTDPIQAERAFHDFATKLQRQNVRKPDREALIAAYDRAGRERQARDRTPRAVVCEPQGAGFSCTLSKPAGPLS
ncbi:MAG TPA: hypothetical protein VLW45_07890 [Pelomicrobium sp.]|nr:hypothetical protein [Pelomicrobium sp.]